MQAENDLLISKERVSKERSQQPKYTPTEEERRRVSTVQAKYREKDTTKRAFEQTWFINGAFLRGQHYVTWSEHSRTFSVPTAVVPHRVRLVVNYIMAYWRRTKARLTAHQPNIFVRPATTDQSDVETAKNATKAIESEMYRLNHYRRFKEGVGWGLETGTWFYYVGWNPWKGEPLTEPQPVTNPETGEVQMDPETGEPMVEMVPVTDEQGRQLFTGEIELDVVSSYEIQVDRNAVTEEDASWMMRSKIRTLSWICENYRDKGRWVKGENVKLHEYFQKRVTSLVGVHGTSSDAQEREAGEGGEEEVAVVHEYWEKPTEKYPRGRLIIVAGNVELWNGENPYDHQMFPFIKIDDITIPGRFWGMSSFEQAIPLNRNYNRARSQEVENRTLMGRPKILVPKICNVIQNAFDAEAGEKIEYRPGPRGEKPELLYPQSTAAATQTEIQHTMSDIQEVLQWHEVSRGILPSANIPAEGIEKLQNSDETAMGDAATNLDIGLSKLGKMILSLVHQFWTEERMVRAGGEGSRLEAFRVRGDELQGQSEGADYLDVRVVPHSTVLKDPAKERQKVKELMEMGFVNPLQHRDVLMKSLDVANSDELFEDERLDEQWAGRENELMEQGIMSVPRDFENHSIHTQVLNRFRKSERYRRLPPHIQALYDQHAALHEVLFIQNAQKAVMMQGAMAGPGAGGEEGGPPAGPSQPQGE